MIIRWRMFDCNGKCDRRCLKHSKTRQNGCHQNGDIFVLKVLSELFKRRQTVLRTRESRGDVKR